MAKAPRVSPRERHSRKLFGSKTTRVVASPSADVASLKTAVDGLRTALNEAGITKAS